MDSFSRLAGADEKASAMHSVTAADLRADHVGSFLRSAELLAARHAGAPPDTLREIEDRDILRVLAKQQELGFRIFTDGEFRRSGFMSDFNDAVAGFDYGDAVKRDWNAAGTTQTVAPSAVKGVVTSRLRRLRRLA